MAGEPGQPTTFIGNATRFFQQIDFDSTYIFGNNQGNNLGITDVETSATFAIPIFKNPFLVTPGFAAHFWNGPNTNGFGVNPGPEMPPETYDAYLDTTWKPQITPRLSADLAVRVGLYSDFNFISYQSVRYSVSRIGVVRHESATDVRCRRRVPGSFVGAHFAGRRRDLGTRPRFALRAVVPAAEAFAPHRHGANSNLWGYVEGEYGGNTWTIHRAQPGFSGDLVDYNDLRLSLGTELIGFNARRMNFEVGYVFNRALDVSERNHANDLSARHGHGSRRLQLLSYVAAAQRFRNGQNSRR